MHNSEQTKHRNLSPFPGANTQQREILKLMSRDLWQFSNEVFDYLADNLRINPDRETFRSQLTQLRARGLLEKRRLPVGSYPSGYHTNMAQWRMTEAGAELARRHLPRRGRQIENPPPKLRSGLDTTAPKAA
jgi:hypothetical protein